jgi:hypothetical protein
MVDAHVHFLHGNGCGYTEEFFKLFIGAAQSAELTEIYLLEHTHQFYEFEKVYKPVRRITNTSVTGSIAEWMVPLSGILRLSIR